MTTTTVELIGWFEQGIAQGATHMIVVCDTYDYEDFPVYVMPGQDARREAGRYQDASKMVKVMEVYDLRLDRDAQMEEFRAFHY